MLNKFRSLRAIIFSLVIATCLAIPAGAKQDLKFMMPNGQTVSLSGLQGKVVVLLFGGVQDPQCRDEFKALSSLADRYKGKDVQVYWVSIDTEADASNTKLNSPCGPAGSVVVLRDPNRAAFKSYGGKVMPTIVVVNQQGQVYGQPRGGFNPNSDFVNDMSAIIDGLLNKK